MAENLGIVASRGGESWQFFAFIFGAVLTLAFALISEVGKKPIRITLYVTSFFLFGYLFLLNTWVRNHLVALLRWFTTEPH